jgi:endogenous inhibitor of DNA gyrase (YacG/DUF329 family)
MPRICPVCGGALDPVLSEPTLPFCSERCRKIDLRRWLGEQYGLPYEAPEDPSEGADIPRETRDD